MPEETLTHRSEKGSLLLVAVAAECMGYLLWGRFTHDEADCIHLHDPRIYFQIRIFKKVKNERADLTYASEVQYLRQH